MSVDLQSSFGVRSESRPSTPPYSFGGLALQTSPAREWYQLGSRRPPTVPGRRIVLTSADRWKALRVDLIDLTGPSQVPEKTFSEHVLVAHIDGPARTDIWFAGKQHTGDALPGDVCVVPAQTPYAVRRDSPGRIVATVLDAQLLEQTAADEPSTGWTNVEPRFCVRDPLLSELLHALTTEVLADNPGGALYAETLGAALAAHLLRKHRAVPPPLLRGGLAGPALRRVTDYIEAHLADTIRLQDLAEVAGVSSFQLVRRFKESKGQPPHQFLLRRRIERAREMLRQSDKTILEVALSCGFSSQSHFSAVFRTLTGLTPRKYRDEL
jgi:AraC family transcriptional regulator